jgi:hypothetical protein
MLSARGKPAPLALSIFTKMFREGGIMTKRDMLELINESLPKDYETRSYGGNRLLIDTPEGETFHLEIEKED